MTNFLIPGNDGNNGNNGDGEDKSIKFNQFTNALDGMDETQIELLQKKIYDIQFKKIEKALSEVVDQVNKLSEAREIDKEIMETQLQLERKRHRKQENRFGYISQTDLGNQFTTAIGSKTMGSMLRLAGIAKAKTSVTVPYSESIKSDYAKSYDTPWGGIIWVWNSERCIEKIDRWLEREGLIDEFYSITDEKELISYIQALESMYS